LIAGKSYLEEERPLTRNKVLTVMDYVFTAFETGSANMSDQVNIWRRMPPE
jgi:hypothetical protein